MNHNISSEIASHEISTLTATTGIFIFSLIAHLKTFANFNGGKFTRMHSNDVPERR